MTQAPFGPASDSDPDLGARLQAALGPQYRIESELGRGGMGVVYRARDTALDRAVAVKVIHPELAGHESLARRFLAEARTIARLRHPNIVTVHAAGTAGDLLYFVMDEIPGETLRDRLIRQPRLEPGLVSCILADLAAALDTAGRAGVVHRDVKPENVLLDSGTGRALLADFGVARAVAIERTGPVTGHGIAIGTPAYMSPEQAAGEDVDSRSDLYGLGVVGYEMLAGAPPFDGPNRVIVSKHIAEPPVPIAELRPDTPPALAETIMRALEKSPAARWQTGEEFRVALAGGAAPAARPSLGSLPPRRPRRRLFAALGGAAALVTLVAVALAGRTQGPPSGENPRHSILVLPFTNLRDDAAVEWLHEGSASMLALNLSLWDDLRVIDQERLHDLRKRRGIGEDEPIGLEMARRLARDAGAWTVVLGEFDRAGDSLHLVARVFDVRSGRRVETAQASAPDSVDARDLVDRLAAQILDLSGAPSEVRAGLAQATTSSLEAFRSYLGGVEALNRWDLATAERSLARAIELDTTFGLAYYKYALTRGWSIGQNDSVSTRAMVRATAHSAGLPAHDRTIINAYRSFIDGDYATARGLYEQLIGRDSANADAWYGLGEAWFHDVRKQDYAAGSTRALRAFRRTLALDPDYSLAYDHIESMLANASRAGGSLALMPTDSFAPTRDDVGRVLVAPAVHAAAVERARGEVVRLARAWVASQPTTLRAHGAMVDAFVAAGEFDAALAEVGRFRELTPTHPELPFVEARIRFAAGDVDAAAGILRGALDSTSPSDFRALEGTPTVLGDVASAANVFAYQGDLVNAAKALDLADRIGREVYPGTRVAAGGRGDYWHRTSLGELYAAAGAPPAAMRRVWQSAAEAARAARADRRKPILASGATAAIGLLSGPDGDTSALAELNALSGEEPVREVRALLALSRRDSASARRALAEPDTTDMKLPYLVYRRPLLAEAYFQLGEYQTALDIIAGFEPDVTPSRMFDARWGYVGRVRLLRAELQARLGHVAAARSEYRKVLAQYKSADPSMQTYVRQAQRGLAALGEETT